MTVLDGEQKERIFLRALTIEVISVTFKAPLDLTVHAPDGMYDPANEHDACGVGMVTTLNKRPERKIVTDAIEVLVSWLIMCAVGCRGEHR